MAKHNSSKTFISVILISIALHGCGDREPYGSAEMQSLSSVKHQPGESTRVESGPEKTEVKTFRKIRLIPDEQLEKASLLIEEAGESLLSKKRVGALYRNNCAICHGMKGTGTMNGAKSLAESDVTLVERVAQVYFGKGTMAGFKRTLGAVEVVSLAKHAMDFSD